MIRSFLACAALVLLGFGCAGDMDPEIGQEEAPITEAAAATNACLHPLTCAMDCLCDFQICMANHGGAKNCDEERFHCVLDCKPGGGGE